MLEFKSDPILYLLAVLNVIQIIIITIIIIIIIIFWGSTYYLGSKYRFRSR
jgi:hypothetical protein